MITPAGLTDVSDDDASPEDSSPADSGTPVDDQIPVTVEPGEADADNNFVDVDQGSISGNVSEDPDGVGTDPLVPIQGVSIELFEDTDGDGNPDGSAIATTTTDDSGNYSFSDLMPGDYVVVESQPANLDSISDQDSTPDGDPFDSDTTVDEQIAVTLESGESDSGNDFVEENRGSITGSVLEDTDGDGVGDTGIVTTVELYADTDGDGQPDGSPITSVTTNPDGSFSFDDVPPGDYVVVEVQPAGLDDVSDSDLTPEDGNDGNTPVDNLIPVTVEPGEDDADNVFVDENKGSISGNVLLDTTGDGAGDTPQGGVTVELYADTDGDGNPDGTAIDSTTTAGDGSYSFDPVAPGKYVVVEITPAGLTDVSDDDASPEDSSPADSGTPVDDQIPVTVEPGEADADNNFVDVDQGSISGNVSEDPDGVGTDPLVPIQGVSIDLFEDTDGDGNPDGSAIATTTTDDSGNYSFSDLMPGDYVVVESQPANLDSISDQDSTPDGDPFDSDTTVDEQIAVTLESGESDSGNDFVEENRGSITGSVLEDTDGDGVGDTGIVTTVELYADTDGDGQPDGSPITSVTTNPDGSFSFDDVPPGDYVVVEVQPAGLDDVSDSDLTPEDGNDGNTPVDNLIPVTVEPGEDDADNVFVDENKGSISGNVLLDTTGDGAGDTPQGGVTVELYADTDGDGNPDGTAIDSTTTAGDGSYSFDPVAPGKYVVVEITPAGLTDVSDDDASPEDSSPADSGTPVDDQIPVTVEPGEADADNNFVDVDQGGISGNVGQDTTGDGNAETAIPGVLIELFVDSNGDGQPDGAAIATTTTGTNGDYSFPGVMPGNYVVVQTQPAGLVSIFDEDQSGDGDAFDGDTTVDNQIAVTVVSGELDDGNNFGEQALASIEGHVLVDNDGDGTGDTGLSGVEVTLLDSNGDPVGIPATTAADGSYSFTDLEPGDYTVVETQPTGYISVSDQDQQPDGDPQDTDTSVDDEIGVNLIPGETDAGNDFVEELPQTCPAIINFDTDSEGAALAAGTVITDQYSGFGITVSTNNAAKPAMIFDSSSPTGGDSDLGTPNQDFGGPGVGAGGAAGTVGENAFAEGNILIITEDGDSSDPDDNAGGGILIFDFATPYQVASVTMIDIESSSENYEVRAYDSSGALITSVAMQGTGNNSRELVNVNAVNVSRLEIVLSGSGGVANIDIVCPDEPSIDIRKQEEGNDVRTFSAGDTVDFEIAVTNTGSVDLTNVTVSDPQLPVCDNTIGFLAAGQTVTYTCSTVLESGNSVSKTWLDNFSPAYSYSGNDGNTNFLGNWTENDPQGGGASSGRVLVGSNNKMWMNNYNYPGGSSFKPSVQRAVDMSDTDTATLSFDWVTHAGVDSNDAVALEVSTNGGSSFTQIDKFWGVNTGGKSESFDVSAHITSNTIFRFRVTDYYGGSDETFKVDNFKIVATGSDAPEGFINIAYVTGEADGQTVTDSDPSEVVLGDVCVPEPSDSVTNGQSYSIWINGEYFSADSDNTFMPNAGNGTARYQGSVTSNSSGTTHAVDMTFSGFTTTPPAGSPKLPSFSVDASNWVYYTNISGSVGPYSVSRRGPAFQVGYGANMNDTGYGASGWMYFTNGSTTLNGDINIQLTDCEEPPVVCEDCVNGYDQITLKVSNWTSGRDQNETVRVREGGLGGTLLFEGQVANGGTFTFNVNNPGATIVVTVQGASHPSEYVKGTFLTDCDLYVNKTSGNSYITFKVTALVGDGQNGDCVDPTPPPTAIVTTTLLNSKSGQCLDNNDSDVNSDVYQKACNGSIYQKWEFEAVGDKYEIVNADSGLCLDLQGSSTSNEANVMQYSCNQTSNQLWEVVPYNGYYQVKSDSSGKCLEVGYNGTNSAYQYTCDGWAGQLWSLTPPQ